MQSAVTILQQVPRIINKVIVDEYTQILKCEHCKLVQVHNAHIINNNNNNSHNNNDNNDYRHTFF